MVRGGAEMIRRYTIRNLHPALPNGPIGKWQEVIWNLIETRADRTGAMIHVALEEVDRGPVVTYSSVSLRGGQFEPEWIQATQLTVEQLKEQYGETLPLFRHIREEEYKLEPHLVTETIKAIASGDIVIQHHKVIDRRGNPTSGVCLDSFISPI